MIAESFTNAETETVGVRPIREKNEDQACLYHYWQNAEGWIREFDGDYRSNVHRQLLSCMTVDWLVGEQRS